MRERIERRRLAPMRHDEIEEAGEVAQIGGNRMRRGAPLGLEPAMPGFDGSRERRIADQRDAGDLHA